MKSKKDLSDFPTLSNKTRDRRWGHMRKMMQDNDVGCLLVFPENSPFHQSDSYFTNDMPGATLIFPLDGEPTALVGTASAAGTWLQAEERGEASWVKDWRFQPGAPVIVEIIKEKGYANSRIGTLGVSKGGQFNPNGAVPYTLWSNIINSLPKATFVELYDQFKVYWITKGEEELAVFKHAAAIAESACEVMLDVVKPGVTEAEIYTAVQYEINRHGAHTPLMILHTGLENPSWQPPKWQYRAQKQRVVQKQDVILSELFPRVGNSEAQAQMCIAVGEANETVLKLGRIARESYEIGVREFRPGVKFRDAALAMNEPLEREGAWHLTPMVHSQDPLVFAGPVTEGIENVPGLTKRFKHIYENPGTAAELVISEGMCFQLEPNACFGRQRINIGGNVVIGVNGAEELNDIPCQLRFVK
jgi:Xaa-Pro aminopeptidase